MPTVTRRIISRCCLSWRNAFAGTLGDGLLDCGQHRSAPQLPRARAFRAAGRRRCPGSPAHARGVPPSNITATLVITASSPETLAGHREWGLRSGAPPPPCCSVVGAAPRCPPSWVPGQGARGAFAGPIRGVLDALGQMPVLTHGRFRTTAGTPRAWAGERIPGRLPSLGRWSATLFHDGTGPHFRERTKEQAANRPSQPTDPIRSNQQSGLILQVEYAPSPRLPHAAKFPAPSGSCSLRGCAPPARSRVRKRRCRARSAMAARVRSRSNPSLPWR